MRALLSVGEIVLGGFLGEKMLSDGERRKFRGWLNGKKTRNRGGNPAKIFD